MIFFRNLNLFFCAIYTSLVLAADVNALNAKTSVAVGLDNVQQITGSLADIKTLYAADDATKMTRCTTR